MKIKAVVNPVSGHSSMRKIVGRTVGLLCKKYDMAESDVFYTTPGNNKAVSKSFLEDCDALVAAGGDGTLHYVVNRMKELETDRPVAYLPTGTSNDVGCALNLPRRCETFCQMVGAMNTIKIDLGLAGDKYFHHVISGGPVTSISYITTQSLKNLMGQMAYFVTAVPKIPQIMTCTRVEIESDEFNEEENSLMFLISNSPVVGGFKHIIPGAKLDDGDLHVMIVKKCSFPSAARLLVEILKGRHIGNPVISYFKTKKLKFKQHEKNLGVSIDGERASCAGAEVSVVPKGLTLIVP